MLKKSVFAQLEDISNKGFVPAVSLLGLFYFFGWVVDVDINKSLRLLHYAAENGDSYARLSLAQAYCSGIDGRVKKDKLESIKWYQLTIKQGFPEDKQALKVLEQINSTIVPYIPKSNFAVVSFIVRLSNKVYEEETHWTITNSSNN